MAKQQVTLSAKLQSASGPTVTGCKLRVTLVNYGSMSPVVLGTCILNPLSLTTPFVNGALSVSLYGNDAIFPSGTRYLVETIDSKHNVTSADEYELFGTSTLDLSLLVPYNANASAATAAYYLRMLFLDTVTNTLAQLEIRDGALRVATAENGGGVLTITSPILVDTATGAKFNFTASNLSVEIVPYAGTGAGVNLLQFVDAGTFYLRTLAVTNGALSIS